MGFLAAANAGSDLAFLVQQAAREIEGKKEGNENQVAGGIMVGTRAVSILIEIVGSRLKIIKLSGGNQKAVDKLSTEWGEQLKRLECPPGKLSNAIPNSGITRTGNKSRIIFDGMEVRAVRDLSHVSESTLRAMAKKGFAAKDINGNPLQLHHLNQNPAGPLVEIPYTRHKIGNPIQHPLGNAPGVGLTAEQRAVFDAFRESYWKARAIEELLKRGLKP